VDPISLLPVFLHASQCTSSPREIVAWTVNTQGELQARFHMVSELNLKHFSVFSEPPKICTYPPTMVVWDLVDR
jgi:hypothetical protein